MKVSALVDGCFMELELSARDLHQLALGLTVAAEAAAGNSHAMQAAGLPSAGTEAAGVWVARFEVLRTVAELGSLALLAQGELVGPLAAQIDPARIRAATLPALAPVPALAGD